MTNKLRMLGVVGAILLGVARVAVCAEAGSTTRAEATSTWAVGKPIVTYFAGPPMSEAVATQMAAGGFNVVSCKETDFNLLQRHGLRGMLHDALLTPATLEAPEKLAKLNELVDRVRSLPAFYSYYITDEPGADLFPAIGKLSAHLRARDPAHLAYINLFPTYASNQQLGVPGEPVAAYTKYLRQCVEVVKPQLLSWDHYQFYKDGEHAGYFLNLALVRQAAQRAALPFLNIVQAAAWNSNVRVPTTDEMRYLVYTSAAYGAQGISYYVYTAPGHQGGIAGPDGTPTPIYAALKVLNPEFVAIATELQPLRSLSVYHTSLKEAGCVALPADAAFRVESTAKQSSSRGFLLGSFAASGPVRDPDATKPTHALLVNLDCRVEAKTMLVGPGRLELFNATTRTWSDAGSDRVELTLPPGGGKLARVRR